MATVIDSLLIQLGFDTTGIERGQKRADEATDSVRKGSERAGKSLDQMGREGRNAFRGIAREALAFFAVLTAGRSLKAFIQDNTESNVALQNMARNIGTTARALGAWGNVAREFGGTASDVSSSMQSLVSQFQTVSGRQNLGIVFGQMGVRLQDAHGHLRSMGDLIPDLAKAAQRLGPQLFSALGKQAGFSQGFINMLEHGPAKLEAMYKALQRYAPSKADVAASQELWKNWVLLTAQSESFGRSIMTSLTPELDDLMGQLSTWVDKNHALIKQDIDQYVTKIADAVKRIDWHKVEQDIAGVAHGVGDVVSLLGGWKNATETLFALWVGSKFLSMLANVVAIGRAMGASSAAMLPFLKLLGAGYVGDQVAKAVDPKDHFGKWVDRHIPGAAFIDNEASKVGMGLSYAQQGGNDGPIYKRGEIQKRLDISKSQWDAYKDSIVKIEGSPYNEMGGAHGAYAGRYQMSRNAIREAAAYLNVPVPSQAEFLSHPKMQDAFFEAYTALNNKYLMAHSPKYRAADKSHKLEDLGYAWNQGAKGAADWLATGKSRKDGFGTDATVYSWSVQTALIKANAQAGSSIVHHHDNTTALISAMDRAQSSSSTTNTIHHHSNTTNISAPITIDGSHDNAAAIAHAVKNRLLDMETYKRQNNSGVQ